MTNPFYLKIVVCSLIFILPPVAQKKPAFKYSAKAIPTTPGCYLFYDKDGDLLYVGKAKNLRKRVGSYFQKKNVHPRTEVMVGKIAKIETRTVHSEVESLVLENNLIKEHMPRYNVRLRDDKNFVYLRITAEEKPKLEITRRPVRDGSTYIGPRTATKEFRNLVRFCQKHFRVKMVKSGQDYYVHQLLGQEEGTVEEYGRRVEMMKQFLNGKTKEVVAGIQERMMQFATAKNFEAAAKMRDLLQSIQVSNQKQTVQFADNVDRDFVHFVREGSTAFFVRLVFRQGKFLFQNEVKLNAPEQNEEAEVIEQFLLQFYPHVTHLPQELFIPNPVEDTDEVENYLAKKAFGGGQVRILVPQRGEKKSAIDLAQKNAEHFRDRVRVEEESTAQNLAHALPELAKELGMKEPPRRIECFDISHFSGQATVASQVVFEDGKPKSSQYRRFQVKSLPDRKVDDFASMTEILGRRFARKDDKKFAEKFPDLIVIDGGKGQLSAVMKAVKQAKKDKVFPATFKEAKQIIALAKREEEVFRPGEAEPLILGAEGAALKLLQRIRDEAHRFGITHHRKKFEKGTIKSELTEIAGIGKSTTQKLLWKFKSVKHIKEASPEELAETVGKSKAGIVWNYFHNRSDSSSELS